MKLTVYVIKEIFTSVLILLAIPVVLVMLFLGFIVCWRCNSLVHVTSTRKYIIKPFGISERVCKTCYKETKSWWGEENVHEED